MTRTEAYLALNLIPNIGPVRVRRLLETFGSPEEALRASPDRIQRVDGFGPELGEAVANWEETIDLARELRRISEVGAHVITQEDVNYPKTLRECYDPPLVLYVWGELLERDRHAIAVDRLAPNHPLRHPVRQKTVVPTRSLRHHCDQRSGPGDRYRCA